MNKPREGRRRVVIEAVEPEIDGGRFPIKRIAGDYICVEADIFTDGHDAISALLLYREGTSNKWLETPMEFLQNDRWRGYFAAEKIGRYFYSLAAWVDQFKSWRKDVGQKIEADQDTSVDYQVGAEIIQEAQKRTVGKDAVYMQKCISTLRSSGIRKSAKAKLALSDDLLTLMERYPNRCLETTYGQELMVIVDCDRARFSTWYEVFPRSCAMNSKRHGTFKDCEKLLPYISKMGFDVLYFPPIHPIGHTSRKGKNNAVKAKHLEPGTPWAIGSEEGGHKSIHTDLGTINDLRSLISRAKKYGIEIALDLAFQCSPDHPYVKEHPEWFRWRPDGTIQYAENPPKKYQDIYPLDFQTDNWPELWDEMKSIVDFWIDHDVRIFRVDNPHTKPFVFWEWLIGSIKKQYPDVIFLAEAFTRPKIMYRLAKLGFSQSYTYFAWRIMRWEIEEYFNKLNRTKVQEFFRPNLWPNTPDILSDYLRDGGRPAFMIRLVLAATLGANYGIYGPAYELCENRRKDDVSEEYLDSGKYEIKNWDIENPGSLSGFIARVNRIRKKNPALQDNLSCHFHPIDNEQIICYSKTSGKNVILVFVNLDHQYKQSGWTELHLDELGIEEGRPYRILDLLKDVEYRWIGAQNYVELDPHATPAHIFKLSTD